MDQTTVRRSRMIELRGDKSRQEVAKDICITPQMLGAIERGSRTPSLELAGRIAEYYSTTVDELFFNQNRHEMCLKQLA